MDTRWRPFEKMDTRWRPKDKGKQEKAKQLASYKKAKNAQSHSRSRPNAPTTRVANYIQDNDQMRHDVVDFTLTGPSSESPDLHPNQQPAASTSGRRHKRKPRAPLYAELRGVQLVVANEEAARSPALLELLEVGAVLSVMEEPVPGVTGVVLARHHPMADRHVSQSDMLNWLRTCATAIASLQRTCASKSRPNVMICCKAGVNCSVAALLGYCLLERKLSLAKGLSMLRTAKQACPQSWDSLSNASFRRHLVQLDAQRTTQAAATSAAGDGDGFGDGFGEGFGEGFVYVPYGELPRGEEDWEVVDKAECGSRAVDKAPFAMASPHLRSLMVS